MRTKLSMKKKTAATITAGVLVAGTAAGAYAYWTTTGSGTGTATTGTTSLFTVTSATTGPALAPNSATVTGGPVQTVTVTVANPGTGYQKVTQVVASIASITGAGTDVSKPACAATDYQLGSSAVGQPATIAFGENLAPGASAAHPVSVQMVDNGANQDNCKLATVNLAFAAS